MSELILIRHGQASFGEDNYDKLSDLGRSQANRLGQHWLSTGLTLDQVFAGPRQRHLDTARVVADVMRAHGQDWPETVVLEALDEHQVDQLLMSPSHSRLQASTELAQLVAEFKAAQDVAERRRRFQRLFEAVANRWIRDDSLGIESWSEFRSRVNGALQQLTTQTGRGKRVAAFTSVGPITVILQRALACTDSVALQTGWRLNNSSLTSFLFSGDRLTLNRFNTTPHLVRQELTYR
jgi:broad specificity phosphatase PhoE